MNKKVITIAIVMTFVMTATAFASPDSLIVKLIKDGFSKFNQYYMEIINDKDNEFEDKYDDEIDKYIKEKSTFVKNEVSNYVNDELDDMDEDMKADYDRIKLEIDNTIQTEIATLKTNLEQAIVKTKENNDVTDKFKESIAANFKIENN